MNHAYGPEVKSASSLIEPYSSALRKVLGEVTWDTRVKKPIDRLFVALGEVPLKFGASGSKPALRIRCEIKAMFSLILLSSAGISQLGF